MGKFCYTDKMEHTERLIVEQLKEGNEEAYKYLYDRHYTMLCHVANEYIRDTFLAETIVGDVIFHIWEIHETLDISTTIRGYLMRAVKNTCLNHLNSERERREVTFSNLPDVEPTRYILSDSYPLGRLLEHELEDKIHHAISQLPAECKAVFMKSRFEDKKYETIAQEMNISINTVKYHIKSALSFLQKDLGKYLATFLFLFFK